MTPPWPRISIVTPSFNQGRYLEETIQSVLNDGYPDLEYVVMDGGSTDDSRAVIERHAARLHYWRSEPDGGQYEAIRRGFTHTSGEVMGWLNSDDRYVPGALRVVGEIFATFPEVEWLTSLYHLHWDETGRLVRCFAQLPCTAQEFFRGENLPGRGWPARGFVQQESTFWRRSLWERAGGLDPAYRYAGDFDLWCRFYRLCEPVGVDVPLAGFRVHGTQKTAGHMEEYLTEAAAALQRHGGTLPPRWLRAWAGVKRRLPPPVARKLAPPVKMCTWSGRGWEIVERRG